MMLIERSEKLGETCNKELQIKNRTKKKFTRKKKLVVIMDSRVGEKSEKKFMRVLLLFFLSGCTAIQKALTDNGASMILHSSFPDNSLFAAFS